MKSRQVISVLLLLACAGWLGYSTIAPRLRVHLQRQQVEMESFEILRQASTEAELKVAVGGLGILITLPDGEWVAVRYRDSHAYPGWSSSVVRDSQGQWWTSDHHFCGSFEQYREMKECLIKEQAEMEMLEWDRSLWIYRPEDLAESQLHPLATSATLKEARSALEKLGFVQHP